MVIALRRARCVVAHFSSFDFPRRQRGEVCLDANLSFARDVFQEIGACDPNASRRQFDRRKMPGLDQALDLPPRTAEDRRALFKGQQVICPRVGWHVHVRMMRMTEPHEGTNSIRKNVS
jgi:hypothetical protein